MFHKIFLQKLSLWHYFGRKFQLLVRGDRELGMRIGWFGRFDFRRKFAGEFIHTKCVRKRVQVPKQLSRKQAGNLVEYAQSFILSSHILYCRRNVSTRYSCVSRTC